MMTNLFSSFDPCSSSSFISPWLAAFTLFIMLPYPWWGINNRFVVTLISVIKTLHLELKLLMGPTSMGSSLIFISLILVIGVNNFMGLFPYIFTSTSHLITALSLAAPLWLAFMLYGWINNTKFMFAHLVPLSTPNLLMPFMVLIESISNIIRPGTLTVRLSANMIAGHLLLTLLGNQTSSANTPLIMMTLLVIQVALLTLEVAVSLIQAYVFTVLSTLYSSEVTNH